jgi:hypothetical protein
VIVLALLLACDAEAPPPEAPVISAEQAEAQAEALLEQAPLPAPALVPVEDGAVVSELAQVVLVWEGISALYKSFFSDPEAVTELAEGLGPHLGSPVDVIIRYNTEDSVGDIIIQLRPDQLREQVPVSGDTIQLQALAPITTAMATYRSSMAARFDVRVESFRVSVESYRGARVCQLTPAGRPPPDGRLVSPCVTINGVEQCGQPSAEGVTFTPEVAAAVRACLDR